MIERKKGLRCVLCRFEASKEEVLKYPPGIIGCPNCGTKLNPMKIEHDIEVSLNWQDIRLLAIYAKRWTTVFDKNNLSEKQSIQALDDLIARLAKYQPEGAQPLTVPKEIEIVITKEGGNGSIPSPYY